VLAVRACIDAPLRPEPATNLLDLVSEILSSVGFNLAQALTAFGPLIQQWCPIMVEDHLLGNCDYKVSEPVNAQEGPQDPVLWMCLWLVLRKPCSPQENMGTSELYAALKQVHVLSQSAAKLHLDVLQMGLMIAIYELGGSSWFRSYVRHVLTATLYSCRARDETTSLPDASRLHGHIQVFRNRIWAKERYVKLCNIGLDESKCCHAR
jgi:hypothetical protein